MGSRCIIVLEADSEPIAAKTAARAFERIAEVEQVLSDYRPNSESMVLVTKTINVWHSVSFDLFQVLRISKDIHKRTQGSFDPSVGAMTHLWRLPEQPSREDLQLAARRVGFKHIELDEQTQSVRLMRAGMILDFGGIGKGYAAQQARELIVSDGYESFSIDMGGDLALGHPPTTQPEGWRVDIVTGLDQSRQAYLSNCAVATSGDLERFYEYEGVRYSHILDPATGIGLTERRAATVIASNATIADALASAASVLGAEQLGALRAEFKDTTIELVSRPIKD